MLRPINNPYKVKALNYFIIKDRKEYKARGLLFTANFNEAERFESLESARNFKNNSGIPELSIHQATYSETKVSDYEVCFV